MPGIKKSIKTKKLIYKIDYKKKSKLKGITNSLMLNFWCLGWILNFFWKAFDKNYQYHTGLHKAHPLTIKALFHSDKESQEESGARFK